MRETREKKLKGKSVRFFAAAALSAALIGGQMPMSIAADNGSAVIEMSELIPENITVDSIQMLEEVKLPEVKYGRLKWVDDSIWLTERVQSCEVLFIPEDGFDMSRLEDWEENWDEEEKGLLTHIKVIVSSIEESGTESGEEEEVLELPADGESAEVPELTATPAPGGDGVRDDETDAGQKTEAADGESASDKTADGDAEKNPDAEKTENTENIENIENTDGEQKSEAEAADSDPNNAKEESAEADSGKEEDTETGEEADAETGSGDGTDSSTENTEHTENTNDTEESGNKPDNIFDAPSDFAAEDERPMDAPEGLTEEEQLLRAQMNHSAEGISVSGINLPWYVQFRVTNGESYEFTNETDAAIFRSYEFELWDLQNNTEYEIPDGEYISVTVPVKEGYDYVIEHLLDNGAYETIIPSVDGNRLVFSTHSFSPFGIAGSKQLVGPDFPIEDVKPSVTPTPPVTGKPGAPDGNNGSNGTGSGNSSSGNTSGTGSSSDGTNGGTGTDGNGTADNGTGNSGSSISGGNGGNNGSGTGNNSGASAGTGNNGSAGSNQSASANNGSQSVNNGHAVRTGDTTPILPFVILVMAAGIIIGVVVFIRQKKK